MSVLDILATASIAIGLFFLLVGAMGILRLPDLFSRLHVTGVLDTLAVPMILVGVALHLGLRLVSVKLVLATIFLAVTSPLVGHLLARAALEAGEKPARQD
ncbi:MAG: monovalent cation/H(+) antiporter subunit G [Gemmatimonadaceae bacterium]|nr:monovalent cation/H(+) antiporter subunit G [Gemmatimonadaceae bacterium]MCW5825546.1 monovalent cation/H(+) antiporter subunit G [Gemmatimonadaceae bacterium]